MATSTDARRLVADLYDLCGEADVCLHVDGDTRIRGKPSRLDRDQAGVRIEVCPYDGDAPQYRVRANRTPTGWLVPRVERRPLGGAWTECGRLVGVETLYEPRPR